MSDKQSAPILPPLTGGGGSNGGANGGTPQQTVSLQQVLATAQGLNVLTTGGGQQFVITSQFPGLTQVIPTSGTTNTNVQQVGVTRIVNISNTSPRVNAVGVASTSGSPLTSPTRQNPAKVVLATSPKLVRTSMFITPSCQASMQSPPARKRLKLSESTEKVSVPADDAAGYRRRIMEHKMKRMRAIREKYAENASELFFLHAGGNMMDFQTWRKRPPTPQYLHFLRQHRLDPDDDDEDLTVPLPSISEIPITPAVTSVSTVVPLGQSTEVKISGIGVTPVAVSTTLPAAVAQLSQQGGTPLVPDSSKPTVTTTASAVPDKPTVTSTTPKTVTPVLTTSQPVVKLVKLPSSSVSVSSDITNNQEQIVEKAKQEAYVMQRIAELQREGLWSERRLPKVQEPARTKAHWDYLLEEMVWLAADFAQERKWKKAAAKKCARMVQKHFQEKAIQAQKAEKSQELRLKKIASFVAKEIKTFWTNVEKLVEYKQQTRLEEKRKKALDQHLNFIVGQTEKYSTWLTEGLNKSDGPQSIPASINSSRISSPLPTTKSYSDEEFQPNQSSDDDEETIAKAEEEMKAVTNHKEEVELLKKESEIPLEDLLKDLPPDYLEDRNKTLSPCQKEVIEDENEKSVDGDTDFVAATDESSDEEDTIMEQEKMEGETDHKQELDDLKAENEMSIDELMARYSTLPDVSMDVDADVAQDTNKDSEKETQENEEQSSSSETESEESENEIAEDNSQVQSDEADVGLKSLLEDLSAERTSEIKNMGIDHSDAHNEMDNVAALAESIQPKGNTLLTTSVVTKIPFLLKHSLREYQHIGLDWLVTMYDRKLNGILADEMGLGKTIQTIALLAHLACEKGNWGPHLVIVPTSVMLNWEMECKKWCPGFKILTYYGTQKERKQKRTGWTKPNAFHICITSYKLVIQDHQSFRRKKWKYLILDEAQNIKNFKSQRWQLLLNFQTQRRLLLTGTPLQNNLMELWSLMHFLMPNVFQSHREFKEWFSNPVTGMIEGNSEYNENIIRRLHKVLRPFLLRRLKTEVEKQLPKKYEHVIMCRLSKRQRYLYDDFMSRAKTKETLASGNLLSVINVLMQLRKVCNHPNLFEVRPTVSPFQMEAIEYITASLVWSALDYDPLKHIDLRSLNLLLLNLELTLSAFEAHRVRRLQTPRKLIEEIDSQSDPPPRCPSGKIKINVRLSNQVKPPSTPQQTQTKLKNLAGILPTPRVGTSPLIKTLNNQSTPGQGVTLRVAGGQQLQGYSLQLVQHQGSVKAIPVGTLAHNPQSTTVTPTTAAMNAHRITVGNPSIRDGLQRLATQTVTVKQGDSVQRIAVPSFAQLVQTSTGRHIILTSNQQNTNTVSFPVVTPSGQRLTVLSKSLMGLSTSATTVNKVVGGVVSTASGTSGRPVMRVPPLNVTASQMQSATGNGQQNQQQSVRCGILTRHAQKESEKIQAKEQPKSEFYVPQLEEERRQRRQSKLRLLGNVNERRCAACPLYGEDLFTALRIGKPATACRWHNGSIYCETAKQNSRTRRQFFSRTEALAEAIKSTEEIVEELKEVFERFVVYVPAVRAPMPQFHVSHPAPHKLWAQQRSQYELQRQLAPKMSLFHPVAGAMITQFPDPRLIQYDCGKLQSLDHLLRKLKSDNHRVLIFTQMTRMLDVLEAFLNFHGHIYLRLDGTTRVDQRQVLMERFNGDKRIFCFILSTRSGGVGVNLTGADTVIFYDSDWNPTMDAQAQDRCHRIGQTRDVHIYRLLSEKTVEENILKKANQKRLLGDLAIEGGNFTTAYFKSSTIQDLFNIDQSENDASARMAEVLEQSKDRERLLSKDVGPGFGQSQHVEEKVAMGALENALAAVEEDLDVQAAKTAKAEAVADLAEFDENIPLDDAERDDAPFSKAEQDVQNLVSQLTPIERYAMKFVEESEGAFSAAQLAAAERELEEQKKEWELDRLRALREEEERRMRLADDDEKPLTFGREDAQNQVNSSSNSKKLVNRKLQPKRRSARKGISRSAQESSESETETTTESESESQEDIIEDSLDEESSHTESQSQGDEDEEEEEEGDVQNDSDRGDYSKRRNRSNKSYTQNHFDLNSPRTRSRGNVKINLWTLDVSPILPGIKPKCRGRASQRYKREHAKAEANSPAPALSTSKKPIDITSHLSMNKSGEDCTLNEHELLSKLEQHAQDEIRDNLSYAERISHSSDYFLLNRQLSFTESSKSDLEENESSKNDSTPAEISLNSEISTTDFQSRQHETLSDEDSKLNEHVRRSTRAKEVNLHNRETVSKENKINNDVLLDCSTDAVVCSSALNQQAVNEEVNEEFEFTVEKFYDKSNSSKTASQLSLADDTITKFHDENHALQSSLRIDVKKDTSTSYTEDNVQAEKSINAPQFLQESNEEVRPPVKNIHPSSLTTEGNNEKSLSTSTPSTESNMENTEIQYSTSQQANTLDNQISTTNNDTKDDGDINNEQKNQNVDKLQEAEKQDSCEADTDAANDDEASGVTFVIRTYSSQTSNNKEKEDSTVEKTVPEIPSLNENSDGRSIEDTPDVKPTYSEVDSNKPETLSLDINHSQDEKTHSESKLKHRKLDAIPSVIITRCARASTMVAENSMKNSSGNKSEQTVESNASSAGNDNRGSRQASCREFNNTERSTTCTQDQQKISSAKTTMEQGRTTRLSTVHSVTSPPPDAPTTQKPAVKRRSGTPLPEFLKSPPRPVTRASSMNSMSKDDHLESSHDEPNPNWSSPLDGVLSEIFLHGRDSITTIDSVGENSAESIDDTLTTRSRKISGNEDGEVDGNASSEERRSSTPLRKFIKSTLRPASKGPAIVNSASKDDNFESSNDEPTTRSSNSPLHGVIRDILFRGRDSISPIKSVGENSAESMDNALTTRSRKISGNEGSGGVANSSSEKRRSGIPLRKLLKSPPRPVTRASSIVNSMSKEDHFESPNEEPTSHSWSSSLDGVLTDILFRGRTNIPTIKSVSDNPTESIDNALTTRSKKMSMNEGGGVDGNTSNEKRRPGTPLRKFIKSPPGPVTRASSIVNSMSKEDHFESPNDEPTSPNWSSSLDGVLTEILFQGKDSIRDSTIDPVGENPAELMDNTLTTRSKKASGNEGGGVDGNASNEKRRSGTPLRKFLKLLPRPVSRASVNSMSKDDNFESPNEEPTSPGSSSPLHGVLREIIFRGRDGIPTIKSVGENPAESLDNALTTRSRKITGNEGGGVGGNASNEKRRSSTRRRKLLKSPPRPVTRASSNVNSGPKEDHAESPNEEPTSHSSSSPLREGLFRGRNSVSTIKPGGENPSESMDNAPTTRSRKISGNEGGGATVNTSTQKRRPDTPLPAACQLPRVTRSGLHSAKNSSSSTPIDIVKSNRGLRKAAESPGTVGQQDSPNTDTNGNAVASETNSKKEDSSILSQFSESNEKPQRTAKVVAILTLDTLSRNNHTPRAQQNCNATDAKVKKNLDSNSAKDALSKNCVVRLSDVAASYKCDGKPGTESGSRLDRYHSAALSNVGNIYTNSNKTSNNALVTDISGARLKSGGKSDNKVSLPMQSAVITLVDLDNEPEYDSDSSKRTRKKIKRTRVSPFAKPLVDGGGKTGEQQLVDALDDDEEEMIPPLKKPVRPQPPPPPSPQAGHLEKLQPSTIS